MVRVLASRLSRWVSRKPVVLLLASLPAFPFGLSATTISWTGGTGAYTNPAKWTPNTVPANNGVSSFDVLIGSGLGDFVTLTVPGFSINSLSVGGAPSTSTLEVSGGGNLTVGSPLVNAGNVFQIGGGGILNLRNAGATLELSGGSSALVGNNGQVNIYDGGSLTLKTGSPGSLSPLPATFTNNSNVNLTGVAANANLTLNGGLLAAPAFLFNGSGAINMTGNASISGHSGLESLTSAQTIAGSGLINQLAGFTNNGTLSASGGTLRVDAPLTNWNAATGTLSGGAYAAGTGSALRLSSLGGNSIASLYNGQVSLQAGGIITGNGSTNALAGLTSISADDSTGGTGNAQLSLGQGALLALAGDLTNGATTNLSNRNLTTSARSGVSLNMGSLSVFNLTNTTTDNVAYDPNSVLGVLGGNPNAGITLNNGSTLTVGGSFRNTETNVGGNTGASTLFTMNNSTGSIAGDLTNQSLTTDSTASFSSGNGSEGGGTAMVSLSASTLTVGGSVSNATMNDTGFFGAGGQALINVSGGSSLTLSGNLSNQATNAGFAGYFAGLAQVGISGSTLSVGGNLMNSLNNGGADSAGGSVELHLAGGSVATVAHDLTNQVLNSGLVDPDFGQPSFASIAVGGGSSLNVSGNFNNLVINAAGPSGAASTSTVSLDGLGTLVTVQGNLTNSVTDNMGGTGAGAAVIALSGGATLNVVGTVNNALGGDIELNGSGTALNAGALNNPGFLQTGGSSTVAVRGLVGVTPAVSQGSSVNVTGDLLNAATGTINLKGAADSFSAGGQFTNAGVVNLFAQGAAASADTLDNQASGSISLSADSNKVTVTGSATNEGMIAFGGTNAFFAAGGDFTNSGIILMVGSGDLFAVAGTLTDSGVLAVGTGETVRAGSTVVTAGGVLGGIGRVQGNVVNDGGTIGTGESGAFGISGNFTQSAAGMMNVNLMSSSSYAWLDVDGNVILDGSLVLTLAETFDAQVGQIFDILNWTGTERGSLQLASVFFDGGMHTFDLLFNPNGHELDVVVSGTTPIAPEPSALELLCSAAILQGFARFMIRRRRAVSPLD